jgi:hypothetical protein
VLVKHCGNEFGKKYVPIPWFYYISLSKTRSKCETDSVVVNISNGTFDSATLNGTSLSSGFSGQSSFTFDTNSAPADLVTCVTPNTTGVVNISYVTFFANGEKCESRVEIDCKTTEPEPSSCCPELDFKLKPS